MENENKTMFAKAMSNSQSFGWKSVFAGVFQKHSREQTDHQFAAGLTGHIPSGGHLLDGWQKPWLFSRFLLIGAIVWLVLGILLQARIFGGSEIALLVTIPAALVPLAFLLFMWEMNIPRNIPIYETLKIFILSGIGVTLVHTIVSTILDNSSIPEENYEHWFIVGLVEEITKLVLVAFFLRKKDLCWGLNGLVIGAAVGCGFAVFETMSYGLKPIFYNNLSGEVLNKMNDIFLARAICAAVGHVAWATMYGGALALAKGKQKLSAKHFGKPTFLITLFSAILLHAAWDYFLQFAEDETKIEKLPKVFQSLLDLAFSHGYIVMGVSLLVIFGIPTFAIILWILRKSVRQVVVYSNSVGSVHADQATPYSPAPAPAPFVPAYTPVNNAQPAPAPTGVLLLECLSGELAGQTFTIQNGRSFTIGRGTQNNVQYSDGAKGISRSHCTVSFDGRNALVTDLGSTHGTFLGNGQRFQPNLKYTLNSGDQFYLATGTNTFRVTIR